MRLKGFVGNLCARHALQLASLSGDGHSPAPGDSDAPASAAYDIDMAAAARSPTLHKSNIFSWICACQALQRTSLSGDGHSPAPGDSDAAASAASDIDTDGCGSGDGGAGGGSVWQPLAESAPPVPGREWVPIQAGSLALDPHGFYQLVLREGVGPQCKTYALSPVCTA